MTLYVTDDGRGVSANPRGDEDPVSVHISVSQ